MKKNGYVLLSLGTVAAMGLAVLSLISTSGGPTSHARLDGNASGRAAEVASRTVRGAAADWGKLPLRFEANAGQVDGATQFVARGPGYNLLLGGAEATLVLERPSREALPAHSRPQDRLRVAQRRTAERAIVRMEMVSANKAPAAEGLERLQTETNYFIGDDPSKWHRNVPNYGRVKYREVYPGVDVIYYGKDQRLEYDLVVAAGANAKAIRMRYTGAESLRVDGDGALVLRVKGGDVRELRPRAYQTVAGVERPVEARYVLKGNEVEFALGEYDRSQALVIDPALVFSTYFGGNGTEFGFGIAVDGTNNVYLAGSTTSTNLPVTTTIGPVSNAVAIEDVFVVKLNATATAVTYCDYIGGSNFDEALTIAVDGSGNAFIGGDTASSDFPGTAGNAQPAFNGTVGATTNGWLAELNAAGTMLSYATYLGGNGSDAVNDLTIDGSGVIYATGFTTSSGATPFPTTAGAFQTTYGGPAVTPVTGDAFVAKVNPALAGAAGLVYSTYVGGSGDEQGQSIVIDGSGNAYIAGDSNTLSGFPTVPFAGVIQPTPPAKTVGGGPSGFVAELNAAGSALTFFTYLGGNANDAVVGMTRDAGGNIYVTGHTASTNFPVVPAAAAMPPAAQTMFGGGSASVGDAFVTKMNGSGTTIAYSTYLGGSGDDSGSGIRVDSNGFAYVVGFTSSANFPVTAAANQAALAGARNAFIATVNPIGTQVVYASYHGGNGTDFAEKIAIDGSKNIYFTGSTTSSVFPTTAGVVQTALGGAQNAFAAKFDASAPAASLLPAMLAFGNQNLNTPSASQALTYTNSGNAALTITSIVASAGYSEVDNCAGMIAAGAFCTVNVTFQPTVAGPDPGTVTATDNAGGSPRVITLTGTGVATAPVATLLPAMLAFGNQRINTPSASKALTYTNSGNAALVIASIVASAGYS